MLSSKHRSTLGAIFARPVRSDIRWADIESLLRTLDADLTEGAGSRVRILLNGRRAVFQRPHPDPDTDKGAVTSTQRFLSEAGVTP
jgi:hypothetical protein